jgi:hypothetical protein
MRRTSAEGSSVVCCRVVKTDNFFGLKSQEENGFFSEHPEVVGPRFVCPYFTNAGAGSLEPVLSFG